MDEMKEGRPLAHQASRPNRQSRMNRLIRTVFRSRSDLLVVVPITLIVCAVAAAFLPQRTGLQIMAMVFEPFLFILTLVVLTPLALLFRARTLGSALLVTVIVGSCLFGSEWISLPFSGEGRPDISVMNWNVQFGTRTPAEQAAQLETANTDIVALIEMEPDASAAIEKDAVLTAQYPYRALAPRPGPYGLAVLSRYPISIVDSTDDPACLDLIVDAPQGKIHVIAAHPSHAAIDTVTRLRLPVGYDPSERDAAISRLRTKIDAVLASGERLLILGDFNTAPSEPEYSVLAKGLLDTHVEVGEGPGWTWRPSRIDFMPFGFLRIDLQLTAGPLRPVSTSVDCSMPGDHCRLFGDYEID